MESLELALELLPKTLISDDSDYVSLKRDRVGVDGNRPLAWKEYKAFVRIR